MKRELNKKTLIEQVQRIKNPKTMGKSMSKTENLKGLHEVIGKSQTEQNHYNSKLCLLDTDFSLKKNLNSQNF